MDGRMISHVFVTEFEDGDGQHFAGPCILADTLDAATAIATILTGPEGEPLTVLGQLISSEHSVDLGEQIAARFN